MPANFCSEFRTQDISQGAPAAERTAYSVLAFFFSVDQTLRIGDPRLGGREDTIELSLVTGLHYLADPGTWRQPEREQVAPHDQGLWCSLLDLQSPGLSQKPLARRKTGTSSGRTAHLVISRHPHQPVDSPGLAGQAPNGAGTGLGVVKRLRPQVREDQGDHRFDEIQVVGETSEE